MNQSTKNNRNVKNEKLKFEMALDSAKDQLHENLNPSREDLDKASLKIERLAAELSTATTRNPFSTEQVFELTVEILIQNEIINKGADVHATCETTLN